MLAGFLGRGRGGGWRKLAKGSGTIFAGEAVALPAGLVLAALWGRGLGPAAYGAYAVATSWIILAEMICHGSYSSGALHAAVAPGERTDAEVRRAGMWAGWGMAAVSAILASWGERVLDLPGLAGWIWILCGHLILAGMCQPERILLVAEGRYRERGWSPVFRQGVRLAFTVGALLAGGTVGLACWSWTAGSAAEYLYLSTRGRGARPSGAASSVGTRELFLESRYPFLHSLASKAFERLDLLAVQFFRAPAVETGAYGAAQAVALLPALAGWSLSPVLQAQVREHLAAGREAEARRLARGLVWGLVGATALAPAAAWVGRGVLPWIYGAGFASAGDYFLPILLGACCLLWLTIGSAILRAMDAPAAILPVSVLLLGLFAGGIAMLGPGPAPMEIAWVWAGAAGTAGPAFLALHEWLWRRRAYKS